MATHGCLAHWQRIPQMDRTRMEPSTKKPDRRDDEIVEHHFCLGVSSFDGAPKLHALLRTVAPQGVPAWYSRSPVSQGAGKAYMSILTTYPENLAEAVRQWHEPELGS